MVRSASVRRPGTVPRSTSLSVPAAAIVLAPALGESLRRGDPKPSEGKPSAVDRAFVLDEGRVTFYDDMEAAVEHFDAIAPKSEDEQEGDGTSVLEPGELRDDF